MTSNVWDEDPIMDPANLLDIKVAAAEGDALSGSSDGSHTSSEPHASSGKHSPSTPRTKRNDDNGRESRSHASTIDARAAAATSLFAESHFSASSSLPNALGQAGKDTIVYSGMSIASETIVVPSTTPYSARALLNSTSRYAAMISSAAGAAGKMAAVGAQQGLNSAKALAASRGLIPPVDEMEQGSACVGGSSSNRTPTAATMEDGAFLASAAVDSGDVGVIPAGSQVKWSNWDVVSSSSQGDVPFLSIGYADGKVQVWQLTQRHAGKPGLMTEVLRLDSSTFMPDMESSSRCKIECLVARIVRAGDGNLQLLCVVVHTSDSGKITHELIALDASDARVLERTTLSTQQITADSIVTAYASMQVSARYIAVSLASRETSRPPASTSCFICILNRHTFQLATTLYDTAQPFVDRPPAFDLSGRLLAYACASATAQDHPSKSAAGFAHTGSSANRHSSGGAPSSSGPQQQQQQLLGMAKKVGGTLGQGAWALGTKGAEYLSDLRSRSQSQQQADSHADYIEGKGVERRHSSAAAPETSQFTAQPTFVRVVDLASSTRSPREVVSFQHDSLTAVGATPGTRIPTPLALLRFNSTGELLFTADVHGQVFHVWGIQPASGAARRVSSRSAGVRHLYKIKRGFSSAEIVSATWSPDSKLLHVQSRRGTVHTIALNPHGGQIDAMSTVTGEVGAQRRSAARAAAQTADATLQLPVIVQTPVSHVPPSRLAQPDQSKSAAEESRGISQDSSSRSTGTSCAVIDDRVGARARRWHLLSFDATNGASFEQQVSIVTQEVSDHSTHHEASTSTGSHRSISALTEMLRASGRPSPFTSVESTAMQRILVPVTVNEVEITVWQHINQKTGSEKILALSPQDLQPKLPHSKEMRSDVSGAEIDTYHRAPRALPWHLYLAHQFHFKSFTLASTEEIRYLCDAHRAKSAEIAVRAQVELRPPGEATVDGGQGGNEVNAEGRGTSFDDKLSAAISHAWDPSSVSSTTIPSFPQGGTGRSPSWSSRGIPIRSVTGGISGSLQSARLSIGRSLEAARRVGSGGSGSNSLVSRSGSSTARKGEDNALSFDDAAHDDRYFSEAVSMDATHQSVSSDSLSHQAFGSAETPLTAPNSETGCTPEDEFVEAEDDEVAWDLARGAAEDVEGDELGWDAFGDREFGGKGLTRIGEHLKAKKSAASSDRADDFLIGVFDEETEGTDSTFSKGALSHSATPSSLPATSTLANASTLALVSSNKPSPHLPASLSMKSKVASTPSSLNSSGSLGKPKSKKKK